jgi:FAD/FMN-containing dehydrogenase
MTPVRPAVAVGATSVPDVQACVRFAAERQLPIAVLTTGHQVARPAEGALLINMSRLNEVHIDPAQRMARISGGARAGDVVDAATEHGLAPISGASPTVGTVGFNLGGGHSPVLGRMYGFASDHVQAIEIVTADGRLRRVTNTQEPDLFWALRGAKGNFGVITAMEFALFPVETFYGGGLFFPGKEAKKVLHSWREWVVHLPNEMTSSIAFLRRPSQEFKVHVRFSSVGGKGKAEQALAPLRAIAGTIMDTIAEVPYRKVADLHMDPPQPFPMTEGSVLLDDFPAAAADILLDAVGPEADTHLGFLELRALGGALATEPEVASAVAGREAGWALIGSGAGVPTLAPVYQQELKVLLGRLAPWTQEEMYTNLLPGYEVPPSRLRSVYGAERYKRLEEIKRTYDPHNLFRMNHNIPPA